MPSMLRIYSGEDGLSHIEEMPLPFEPFVDVEGAYGQGTPVEPAAGVTFRVSPAGYFFGLAQRSTAPVYDQPGWKCRDCCQRRRGEAHRCWRYPAG